MVDRETFWQHAKIQDNGCVIWCGSRNKKGYGRASYKGKAQFAHRVAYQMLVGPIPFGHEIDHLCRNRACINVLHLEVVTHGENVRRAAKEVTRCPRGHEYTEENTLVRIHSTNGGRFRTCRRCLRRTPSRAR